MKKKLIVISGATASGKTDLAIEIAKYFNTEILSADSRQCYKEMNIGVAKPSESQLKEITHYFINSHSVYDEVNASVYENYGLQILEKIFQKNEIAVCVGGTGLYIKALCEGIDPMPPIDKDIEQNISHLYKVNGLAWLQQEIQKIDTLFAESAEMQNPHRLLRALIFKLSTNQSILDFRKKEVKNRYFDIKYFAIDIEKNILYDRINKRVDSMIQEGLIEEVKKLLQHKHLKALNTVGYSELLSFLNNECDIDFAIEKIKQHTRNYAKRQITWCKNQQQYKWIKPKYENIIQALNI